MPSVTEPGAQAVGLFDHRPFFEKALQHGIRHGSIPADRLDSMRREAPKGIVQIARYFGTEFLRPDLELAKQRFVNLISLHLHESSAGDLDLAAQALRDHSLLSRSKGGSDMLKSLIGMPQSSHFGMHEPAGFRDEHIPLLGKWTLRTVEEYRAELSRRQHAALLVDAAAWMAHQMEMSIDELADAAVDAEAVIRTALLAGKGRRKTMPDWPAFEQWILALRKKSGSRASLAAGQVAIALPIDLPGQFTEVVDLVRQSVVADLSRILDPTTPILRLFTQNPAFVGRYFWAEDAAAELDRFEHQNSAIWDKASGGHRDEGSLLTLFLRIAAGKTHTTLLSPSAATSLIRAVRKTGLDAELARAFIRQHAPVAMQNDYIALWDAFVQEAEPALRSDRPLATQDALALLRRECNVSDPALTRR